MHCNFFGTWTRCHNCCKFESGRALFFFSFYPLSSASFKRLSLEGTVSSSAAFLPKTFHQDVLELPEGKIAFLLWARFEGGLGLMMWRNLGRKVLLGLQHRELHSQAELPVLLFDDGRTEAGVVRKGVVAAGCEASHTCWQGTCHNKL